MYLKSNFFCLHLGMCLEILTNLQTFLTAYILNSSKEHELQNPNTRVCVSVLCLLSTQQLCFSYPSVKIEITSHKSCIFPYRILHSPTPLAPRINFIYFLTNYGDPLESAPHRQDNFLSQYPEQRAKRRNQGENCPGSQVNFLFLSQIPDFCIIPTLYNIMYKTHEMEHSSSRCRQSPWV